jgi:hypothetical protein
MAGFVEPAGGRPVILQGIGRIQPALWLGLRHSSQMLMAIPMNSNRLLNPPLPGKGHSSGGLAVSVEVVAVKSKRTSVQEG